MSNASPLTLFLIRYPVIIFSLIMLIAGLLGLVFGRLSIGHIRIKGVAVPDLKRLLFSWAQPAISSRNTGWWSKSS